MWAWLGRLFTARPPAPPCDRAGEAVGLAVAGSGYHPMVAEGAALPAAGVVTFVTSSDNQSQIDVPLLARRRGGESRPLGSFIIRDIPPAPAGHAAIAVTVRVRVDGAVEVAASDPAGGLESTGVVGRVDVVTG